MVFLKRIETTNEQQTTKPRTTNRKTKTSRTKPNQALDQTKHKMERKTENGKRKTKNETNCETKNENTRFFLLSASCHPSGNTPRSALAMRWPRLHRMSPWFDEVYLAVSLLVESRFLANHSSLLSESFYGLRRCRYAPKSGSAGEIVPPFLPELLVR